MEVLRSFGMGQQERQTRLSNEALSGYAQNPNDPGAFQRLAEFAPLQAIQIQGQRATQQNQQRTQNFGVIARLARTARNQQDWDAGIQIARGQGIDVPPDFMVFSEPNRAAIMALGDEEDPRAPQPTSTQRDYEFFRETLGEGPANQYLQNRANPTQWVPVTAEDGSVTLIPAPRNPGVTGGTPAPSPSPPRAQNGSYPDPSGFTQGRLTSGRRTSYGNAQVGGVPNSAHTRGDAMDYTPNPGQSMAQLEQQAREYYGPNARIINEGNHVHVELPGYGQVQPYGRRGTQTGPTRRNAPPPPDGFTEVVR